MPKVKLALQKKKIDILGEIEILNSDLQKCISNPDYPTRSLVSAIYQLVNKGALLDQFNLKSKLFFNGILMNIFNFSGSNYMCVSVTSADNGSSFHQFEPLANTFPPGYKIEKIDVSKWWGQEKFWISKDNKFKLTRYNLISEMRNSVLGAHTDSKDLDADLYSIAYKNVMQITNIPGGINISLADTGLSNQDLNDQSQRSLLRSMVIQIAFELKSSIITANIKKIIQNKNY